MNERKEVRPRRWLAVLLLSIVFAGVVLANEDILAGFTRCNSNAGICMTIEQCPNGQANVDGEDILVPRLSGDDFDECNQYGRVCCPIPTDSVTETPVCGDEDWSQQCGEKADVEESMGLVETNRWEFPWSVAVFSIIEIGNRRMNQFLCGGSVIEDGIVVTTAKCVRNEKNSTLRVQFGKWDLTDRTEQCVQELSVEEIVFHPKYVPSSRQHNIALLFLDDNARLGRWVNRVCLPEPQQNVGSTETCYIVGWNAIPKPSNPLFKLRVEFQSRQVCESSIRRYASLSHFNLLEENTCTAYLDEMEKHPCARAEGSGLICESPDRSGQFFLVGIASYALRVCQNVTEINVFVSVKHYKRWIDKHMKEHSRHPSFYHPDPVVRH
ncbi:inactive CLIP domain-containing serine protease A30-like [Anopheles bellator]|uniref:inactive CLIP domain-containing serine protease A30-like n=1 Tax=Anopheles bellator TaxID=139047 RepID=UPI002649A68E|nr:inactive CLIP domain-containing serine protease A30-like [Anopheles bellator]XP_058054631.1 inactive CLIP domain-containing serine protease A30-like [Anopheles bellator]